MTTPRTTPRPNRSTEPVPGGHGPIMIACCIAMLIVAIVLTATGVLSAGFLFAALGFSAIMMALILAGMNGTGGDDRS